MALAVGTRLGPYEIREPLGKGGMGEVYKATDTRLDRSVAIKILPDDLSTDPLFRQRFEREARVISKLDNPHICALYDVGQDGGTSFLVLQYLEGETLADRLRRGALPLNEALTIAIQIATALDRAHRAGITHRDLKPGNVMLVKGGARHGPQAKLLDFGLAKDGAAKSGLMDFAAAGVSVLPTGAAPLTAHGAILGTFQYMAPEQLEGRDADARTDLFAFGVVLYEMLTGRRAFDGQTQASLIAAILERDPPSVSTLQPVVPAALDQIVSRCLAKDPDTRWQSASDLAWELQRVGTMLEPSGAPAPASSRRRLALLSGAAAAIAAAVAATAWLVAPDAPPPARVARFLITPPAAAAFNVASDNRHVVITPDGTRVVYAGPGGVLFVRALDQLDASPLTNIGLPIGPFISPDSQWIGFSEGGGLKKVAITGGPAVTVTGLNGAIRGASWGADGTIVFATQEAKTGLQEVAAAGGEPRVITQPDSASGEADHLWPEILPGGGAVLFTVTSATGAADQSQIVVLDRQTGRRTTLVKGGTDAHYVPSGHLVYGAAGTLRAVAFDLDTLTVSGAPVPIVPQIVTNPNGGIDVGVASDGTVVYAPGIATVAQRTPVWVDRQGQETPLPIPPRAWDQPRISPDGAYVVLHGQYDTADLWLWDVARAMLTRLTFDPLNDLYPAWMPDSRRLVFSSERSGQRNLFAQSTDGTGAVDHLVESPNQQSATSVSPDGLRLVFTENAPKSPTGNDVMQLRLDGSREIVPLVQTAFIERNAEVSPDGRWLAYEANDTGVFEIYVRPFPAVASGRWQVSSGGGRQPLWSRSSAELFYLDRAGALLRVGVEKSAGWIGTAPQKVLEPGYYTGTAASVARNHDITPDGRRFLVVKPLAATQNSPSIVVVQHWGEELKQVVTPQ